jgi:hypothetical protein
MREGLINWYTDWINFWFDHPLFFFGLVFVLTVLNILRSVR